MSGAGFGRSTSEPVTTVSNIGVSSKRSSTASTMFFGDDEATASFNFPRAAVTRLEAAGLERELAHPGDEEVVNLLEVAHEIDVEAERLAHRGQGEAGPRADADAPELTRPLEIPARLHESALDLEPERLGVDHQPIHVEEERARREAVGHHARERIEKCCAAGVRRRTVPHSSPWPDVSGGRLEQGAGWGAEEPRA